MSKLIAFWSPSGAGSTTLLLNTAAALGARRANVAAADLNLTAPSLALAADLLPHDQPQSACLSRLWPALEGGRLSSDELYGALLHHNGFALLPGMLDVVTASRMTEGHVHRMLQLLGARFELVLADLTPALDSVACLPVLEQADLICLVVGPEIGSRFHTRRNMLPIKAIGLEAKVLPILNRGDASLREQVSLDIDLPIRAMVPECKLMGRMVEAGVIAYQARAVHPSVRSFQCSVEELATLVARGGTARGSD